MNTHSDSVSVKKLLQAIRRLPEDTPVYNPQKWYRTQKEHWIGWLKEYEGPGFYGRKTDSKRDAKFAYNHIVEPKMLLWLAEAAGIDSALITVARTESEDKKTMMQQSGIIRKHIPWELVARRLWPDDYR